MVLKFQALELRFMTVTKKNISKEISHNAKISDKYSKKILDIFLKIIKNKSKNNIIKIHRFGTFFYKKTSKRIGRNPKTGQNYKIKPFKRFTFKANNSLKKTIN